MAAKELEDEGVGVSVLNLATIKPLDKKGVLDFAKNIKRSLRWRSIRYTAVWVRR